MQDSKLPSEMYRQSQEALSIERADDILLMGSLALPMEYCL